jgi:beta-glucanase (GH16 family)
MGTVKRRFGARVGVLSLALLMLATACGGSDDVAAAPATTAAPTTTAAPPTTATTEPPTTTTTTTTSAIFILDEAPEPLPIEAPEGYELVWADEFDGDEIDLENWTYDLGGWGWGNGEAQYYTDRTRNARVQDGVLIIDAHFERFENSYYTSARLKSEGLQEFQYGYFEARTKVPAGKGMWPAFWMLGTGFERDEQDPIKSNWPFAGEIDVMEYIGREPDRVFGTIHGPGYAGATSLGRQLNIDEPVADDWHTYAVEWTEDGFRWFFDGEFYGERGRDVVGAREWVYDQPFFLLLNLALGGQFPGPIGLDVEFPKQFLVDHVRVYQRVDES